MPDDSKRQGPWAQVEALTQQLDMMRDALQASREELRQAQEMIGAQARIQAATEHQRRDQRRRYIEGTAARVLGPLLIVRQSDSVQSRRAAALAGDAVLLARALADDIDELYETKPQKGRDDDKPT